MKIKLLKPISGNYGSYDAGVVLRDGQAPREAMIALVKAGAAENYREVEVERATAPPPEQTAALVYRKTSPGWYAGPDGKKVRLKDIPPGADVEG